MEKRKKGDRGEINSNAPRRILCKNTLLRPYQWIDDPFGYLQAMLCNQ